MPVARLIADCAETESAVSAGLPAHHGPARPGQQSSTVGLNPPSHRALSALRVRVRLHCTAVNRNPDIISSPYISPLLLAPLALFPHAKPSLSVSSPSRGESESPPPATTPGQLYKGSFCGCRHCQVHRMKRLVLLLRAATARQAAPEESPEESLEAGGRLPGLLERQWYYPLGSYLNKITTASGLQHFN